MRVKYTLHQGDIWGSKRISREIFKVIGLRDNHKVPFEKLSGLQRIFQKRAEKYLAKKLPSKKVNVDLVIYNIIHKNNKIIGKYQAFCDINIYNKKEEEKRVSFKKNFEFPKDLKKTFEEYKLKLQKEMKKQARRNKAPKGINEPSLIKTENELKELVNQYYPLLIKILLEDKNENKRADAAWLLSWSDKKNTADFLYKAFEDPSHIIHNNAALAFLSLIKTKNIKLKARPIYNLLRHPSTICRNKGGFLLIELIQQNKRIKVPKDIVKILKKMSFSHQPNNAEPASTVLNLLKKRLLR